ncbi:hypothetical protein IQ283_05150 [Alkalihalobacillus hwajinpoensis]|uniref:hypothetical protein n=1 Tax=Guptibacillus hwajinpoensis TaxID=208199 RepID=UPI001883FAB0|nr:hypothetical protein [Pseudalkalibacillus hwajinpoensis]MBF0705987.1 hypothetical protein [Pseudalkalibacillus hwajinpoensis]
MKFGRVIFDFHRTLNEKVESITPALRKFDEFFRSVNFEALTENMNIALESFEKGVCKYKS